MQRKANFLTSYISGVISELRKVTWPTWQVVVRNLVSVVLGIGVATLFVGLIDFAFIRALGFFINR